MNIAKPTPGLGYAFGDGVVAVILSLAFGAIFGGLAGFGIGWLVFR